MIVRYYQRLNAVQIIMIIFSYFYDGKSSNFELEWTIEVKISSIE